MEIPSTITTAIEIMKTCFGGTDIKLLSEKLTYSDKYKTHGAIISIKLLNEHNLFLTTALSEDICFYGSHIASELIYEVCENDIKIIHRKLKLMEISNKLYTKK